MTRKTYCGNLLWQSSLTLLAPALERVQAFAKAEFGTEAEVIRDEVKIPNTRAPYHVQLRLKVDASKRVQELAA